MRSFADDIEKGLETTEYKIVNVLWDGKGGRCVYGAAIVGVLGGESFEGSPIYTESYRQSKIVDEAIGLNNGTNATLYELLCWVEQQEWMRLGIPTKAMRMRLEEKKESTCEVS